MKKIVLSRSYIFPLLLAAIVTAGFSIAAQAQQEGPTATQVLVAIDAKTPVVPAPANIVLKIENRDTPVSSFTRVSPSGAQIALLIDDGLRLSAARELESLRNFVQTLPQGTEIFIGYMQNGRVVPVQNFTTNFAAAAQTLRPPQGLAGASASPYFCLSDFVKNWPSAEYSSNSTMNPPHGRKARFVMMISNGVDPYNGSTSPLNQDSPYVATAITDAQRAGVPVYSIYFADAGLRGERASFSGQSYLAQVADGTGGRAYFEGTGSPVSFEPFLIQFQKAMAETYVATFEAPGEKKLVRVKVTTNLSGAKLRVADQVRPGTIITGTAR